MSRTPTRSTYFPYTTLFRSPGPGRNTLLINASAEGTTSAAAAPWNALPTKSCQGTDETAHIIDAMVKATVPTRNRRRSEEHTSELQSRFDLVCRLLLEKKKY